MHEKLQEENLETFNALLHCLKHEAPLALVGSGLVMRAGYPSWDGLLQQLHAKTGIDREWDEHRLRFIRGHDDSLFRADVYRDLLGENTYRRFLRKTFKPSKQIDGTLRTFIKLPFDHFMTTNYDPTLQDAYTAVHGSRAKIKVVDWLTDAPARDSFITSLGSRREVDLRYFVHIHGIFRNPKEIVLSDRDYMNRYVREENTRRLLFAIFAIKPIVFVGFGMKDPELMQLLRTAAASQSVPRGRHFVLLAFDSHKDNAELIRDRFRNKFDVRPLFYPVVTNHKMLDDLIEALQMEDPERLPNFTRLIEPPTAPVVAPARSAAAQTRSQTAQASPARPKPAASRRKTRTVFDPDDPQKGQWGGKNERNGRRFTARVKPDGKDWFQITLKIEALPGTPDLTGPVWLYLHDTFPEPVREAFIDKNGRTVMYTIGAYGSFTVGAEVGDTKLELDLADPALVSASKRFRER